MNAVETRYARKQSNKGFAIIQPALAFLLLFLTVACSLMNRDVAPQQTLGHDQRLEGEAVLVCSQACRDRGQCGTVADEERTVILGGLVEPRTNGHEVLLPAEERVFINSVVPFTLRERISQEQLAINFYNVTAITGQTGWVAGWCVAQTAGPAQ